MKKLLLLTLVIFLCLLPACGSNSQTIKSSSISTPEVLENYIEQGMSFDDIRKVMSSELYGRTLIFPAQDIYQEGKIWHFTSLEVGEPGDRNAPYFILVCYPEGPITNPHYIVIFKDGFVIGDAWFDWETATDIQKLLWTTETTD